MAEQTPAGLRYRLPAEWEPHAATWLAWPHNRSDWPGKFPAIPWVYAEIVRHLCRGERVRLIVNHARAKRDAARILRAVGCDLRRIDFFRWLTDRSWTRDFGPLFVKPALRSPKGAGGRRKAIVDFHFNGWAKYPNWRRDARVAARAAHSLRAPLFDARALVNGRRRPFVLEGGTIDTDGQGTLLATEECLLSKAQQRNPGLTRAGYEQALAQNLGIRKVLWLGRGIRGDDTHGHVDDIARFVAPGAVVCALEKNPRDPNYARLRDNFRRLEKMRDARGLRLRVVPLPMPAALTFRGQRLPASYANFYIANEVVLVPTFNDRQDRVALATLAELFPGRRVVGIHSVDLVWGLGTLHCLTQQEPF